ncbi:MAG: hypothetical protein A2Y07_10490 [Planctomycetes bacterium GWF2_50_10]|nr:MAG: hypothetical protein A2Y07_10490 [Planctomycetes bacterium GWF2_50_10]
MELFEAISQRHSYREVFGAREVTKEELRKIVEAGLAAPSGCNAQTTDFVIVDEPGMIARIAAMNPTSKAMQSAKAFIFCITDKEPAAVYQDLSFAVEDCAAAVENMLLAITGLGLATVWIDGWLRVDGRSQKIGQMLNVPESKVVRIMLPIGQPMTAVQRRPKKSFAERAFWNRYKK